MESEISGSLFPFLPVKKTFITHFLNVVLFMPRPISTSSLIMLLKAHILGEDFGPWLSYSHVLQS